jgi:hypothetical protein
VPTPVSIPIAPLARWRSASAGRLSCSRAPSNAARARGRRWGHRAARRGGVGGAGADVDCASGRTFRGRDSYHRLDGAGDSSDVPRTLGAELADDRCAPDPGGPVAGARDRGWHPDRTRAPTAHADRREPRSGGARRVGLAGRARPRRCRGRSRRGTRCARRGFASERDRGVLDAA